MMNVVTTTSSSAIIAPLANTIAHRSLRAALFTERRRARALCHRQVPARLLRMRTVSLPRGHQSASIQPALRANNSR